MALNIANKAKIAAEAAKKAVEVESERLTADALRSHGDTCLAETAWLDARGLDDSFLPEPDGPDSFYVAIEDQQGSHESRGSRHYE